MSESKKYYWLKLKTDFFNQREIKKLRKIAGGDTFTIIYLKMQLLSVKTDGVIKFEGTEEHLDEQLALELDEDIENIRMTILFLHQNMLIEPISNDEYLMPRVCESIGSETTAAERMRKSRSKSVTSLQPVTNCYTEIELELEKEIELEKDNSVAKPTQSRFAPPTIDEVKAYCIERHNDVDAGKWHDFYSAKGWMVGKNKMKDWRAAVRTWEKGGANANPSGRKVADF